MILRYLPATLLLCSQALLVVANFDLFGLHKDLYEPRCAHACREPISNSILNCTSTLTRKTSPLCYATDDAFLQTLGYCISQHCNVGPLELDTYWNKYAVGWQISMPTPKYNYAAAVVRTAVPTIILDPEGELQLVSRISDEDYKRSYDSLVSWTDNENLHARYALILLVLGFVIPILLSLCRFMPIPVRYTSQLSAHIVYPTLWRRRWSMQIRESGDISPTRGQACFILYMILLNAVFLGIGHYSSAFKGWSVDGKQGHVITCIANRCGASALANIPLLFLYAGRNNFVLLLTNWSHTTFIMLHRWLGYIVVVEAVLHSILYLGLAVERQSHTAWSHTSAWIFGSMGTVSLALIAPLSIVWFRRRRYEVFLFVHIVVSVCALVGAYFHIWHIYNTQVSGWVIYIWVCVILWSLDRVVRLVRLAFNGLKKAHINVIDEEYIRVDIPEARGYGHVYLYFPTLTWRFWENHPFSIATAPRRAADPKYLSRLATEREGYPLDLGKHIWAHSSPILDTKSMVEKDDPGSPTSAKSLLSPYPPTSLASPFPLLSPTLSTHSLASPLSTSQIFLARSYGSPGEKLKGLTFFMRTHTGTTAVLRRRSHLPVLVEASYGPVKDMSMYPILICIAGGVGITAVLPYLHSHSGTTRLYWGSRSQGLVEAMRDETHGYNGEIVVGRRLLVRTILQRELARFDGSTDVAIVVSGPKSMCEEVREVCCATARRRTGEMRFLDENFSW